ncbi:MAG: integration host factor subunit alpha [Sphingobium sp.]
MADNGTLTRADLAETMNQKIGLSRAESAKIVEKIIDLMCDALADGENVKISGFGTFVLRDKNGRIGRNPKTGVEVPINPRRVLTFRPSQIMRDQVAAG